MLKIRICFKAQSRWEKAYEEGYPDFPNEMFYSVIQFQKFRVKIELFWLNSENYSLRKNLEVPLSCMPVLSQLIKSSKHRR